VQRGSNGNLFWVRMSTYRLTCLPLAAMVVAPLITPAFVKPPLLLLMPPVRVFGPALAVMDAAVSAPEIERGEGECRCVCQSLPLYDQLELACIWCLPLAAMVVAPLMAPASVKPPLLLSMPPVTTNPPLLMVAPPVPTVNPPLKEFGPVVAVIEAAASAPARREWGKDGERGVKSEGRG
jgi:hypothetical protein